MEKILLTVEETKGYLGLGDTQTRHLMRSEYFGCRIGNRLYSSRQLLEQWVLEQCGKHEKKMEYCK